MAERRIDVVITENGARTVKANLDAIGQSASGAGNAVETLRQTLSTAEARFASSTARNDATLRKSMAMQNEIVQNGIMRRDIMHRNSDDRSYRQAQLHGDRQVMATTMFAHKEFAAAVKAGDMRFQYAASAEDKRARLGELANERLAQLQRAGLNREVSTAALASEKLAQSQRAFGDRQVALTEAQGHRNFAFTQAHQNRMANSTAANQARIATITASGQARVQTIVETGGARTAAIQTASITRNTNMQNESAAKIALTAARTAEVQERAALRAAKANAMVSDSFAKLKSVVAGVGGIYAANEIRKAADEYQALQNKLTALGVAQSNLGDVTKRLTEIANKSYSSLEGVGTLYARLISATQRLGASSADMLKFTEAAANAMAIYGTTGGTATGSMLQLSQAMAGVNIRAQEYRSIQDGMLPLLQVVANHIDAAGGSISKLQQIMKAQKLTSKEFFEAVIEGSDELKLALAKIIPTTAQVGTIFRNAFVVAVGQLNDSTGATRLFAVAVHTLAMNLNTIIGVAFGAAAAYAFWTVATISLGTATGALTVAMEALTLAVRANPIAAFVTVLVGAVAYLYAFRKEMMLGTNSVTKMEDLFTALGIIANNVFSKLQIGGQNLSAVFSQIELPTFSDFLTQLAKIVDGGITLFKQFGVAVVAIFAEIPVYLKAKFNTIFNSLKTKINEMRSGMAALINDGRQLVGLKPKVAPDLLKMTPVSQRDLQYRDNVGGAIASVAPSTGATDFVKGLLSTADTVGAQRAAAEKLQAAKDKAAKDAAAKLQGGETTTPDAKALAEAQREAGKFANSLEKIRDKYDGVYKAESALREGISIVNKSNLSTAEKTRLISQMTEELWAAAHPLEAVNRELDRQSSLLQMSSKEQEIANQLYSIRHDLLAKGQDLEGEALAREREKLVNLQTENELSRERNRIMDETVGKLDAEAVHRKALMQMEASNDPQQRLAAEKQYFNENSDLLESNTQHEMRLLNERRENNAKLLKDSGGQNKVAAKVVADIDKKKHELVLNQTKDAFGAAAGLMQSHNKKAFEMGKAAAIAQAVISTYQSAVAVFASAAEIPYIGWIMAPIAAAGAIASGMANVAQIRSQQMPAYAFGGEQVVGGVGGTDSQVVAFRATPGETVRVTTPSQESSAARANGGGDTMIFNMPGITNATQARKSRSQIQRSVVATVSTGKRFK
jgi:tape measure domain-containing protein